MTILITGFEPFGGDTVNPSAELTRRFADETATAILPVDFAALQQQLPQLITRHQPTHVVCLGLSGAATGLTFERVGLNLIDATIPDNSGVQPVDEPVVVGGPDAYFATLPVKAMRRATQREGVPAGLSLTAGSYACNALLYLVLHLAATAPRDAGFRAGFVHVPRIEVLGLDAQEKGLRAALTSLNVQELHYADGQLQ
ncbi:MAG: pyroglutamyl-peptidase I [Propionibacteriaceae bacterium]|nr:pyroglutamyl-peptidase I [Propionibacteriaceae bacterium]